LFNQSSEGFCIEKDVFNNTKGKTIAKKYRDLLCGMLRTDVLYYISLDLGVPGSNKMKLAPLHQKLRQEVEGNIKN
jgi:hypothetical protein